METLPAAATGNPIVRDAILFINSNLHTRLTASVIARGINASPNYLSSLFHQKAGIRMNEYIRNTRLESAAELLRATDSPIIEVCTAVGISDNNYFTKVFKKRFGCTPGVYRRNRIS